jgi:hypothetical protein
MPNLQRNGGLAFLTGAALTFAGCVATVLEKADTTLSDDLVGYPWEGTALVVFSLVGALIQVANVAGLRALRRSEMTASTRALGVVTAGSALLGLCQLASIAVGDQRYYDVAGAIVVIGFALASALVTFGLLAVGVTTLRAGRWTDWRRYAPLAAGSLAVCVIPIQFTSLLWLGVAFYGLGFAVLGVALATAPSARLQTA